MGILEKVLIAINVKRYQGGIAMIKTRSLRVFCLKLELAANDSIVRAKLSDDYDLLKIRSVGEIRDC
jgi:hypothetical protein